MVWSLVLSWIWCGVVSADVQGGDQLVFRPLVHQPRIYSGAPAGVHVTTVHAYDPDRPRRRVEYNLPNVLDHAHFVVDGVSGNLSTALVVEKQVGEIYQVMVAAVGSGTSELEHLQIAVTPFNQFAPRFQSRNYTLELHREAPLGTAVLRTRASDPDPEPVNAEVYYKLDQNESSRFFEVDPFRGELSLREPLNESDSLGTFGVYAEDGGSPKRWDYVPVYVVMKTISAPQNISVSNITHDSAVVCWEPPSSLNASGYVVRCFSTDENFLVNVTDEFPVCARVGNLTDETEYSVEVYGWNGHEDTGQKSDVVGFNTTENWCKNRIHCQAAGHCTPLPTHPYYTCDCPTGFYGDTCHLFDPCSLRPCSNEGRCVNVTHNEYVCVCTEDFHGPDCASYDPCRRKVGPCLNNGTCRMTTEGTFVCLCGEGFVGRTCEVKDPCLDGPCENGGTCEGNGGLVCSCPVGFSGATCGVNLDECASSPCLHGSTCVDGFGTFSCICPAGFSGDMCGIIAKCAAHETETDEGLFYWNATNHSEKVLLPCPFGSIESNSGSFARRTCTLQNGTAIWGAVNASECKGKEFVVADELADELHDLTKDPRNLSVETLETAAQGLQTIASYATKDKKIAEGMAKVISNLMEVNHTIVTQNDTFTDFSESVLQIVDNFVSNVEIKPGESLQLESENVRMEAMDWQPEQDKGTDGDEDLQFTVPNQMQFPEEDFEEKVVVPKTETSFTKSENGTYITVTTTTRPQEMPPKVPMVQVFLPKEALQEAHRQLEGSSVRVKFVVYYSDKLFQPKVEQDVKAPQPEKTSNDVDTTSSEDDKQPKTAEKKEPAFKAPVLQISVGNVSLTNMFKPLVYVIPLTTERDVLCVYWNAKDRQWSSDGLTTNHTKNYVICQSNHMTAFSVLLDLTPKDKIDEAHEPILSLISYVGNALSILGLTFTIITYLLFKSLNRDQTGKILSNLCLSLLLLNSVFLLGLLDPPLGSHLCAGLGLALHYLVLTSLCWMGVEALNMHRLLVRVFGTSSGSRFMLKRCLAAWGGPLLIVVLTASINPKSYYEDLLYCMLSPRDPWIYYGAFLAPSCLLLLGNVAVFVMVSRVVFAPRLKSASSPRQRPPVSAAQLRGAFTVMVLLGVTWVFGTFALGDLKLVLQYAFCFFNSLQGFLIFLVRCLLYPEARGAWAHLLRTGRRRRQKAPPPSVSFSNSHGGGGARSHTSTHVTATRNNSREEGEAAVALDGSLFGRKSKNSNRESAKNNVWIPASQNIAIISSNEVIYQNEKKVINLTNDTFPKMRTKRSTVKRLHVPDYFQPNPIQTEDILTITSPRTVMIPNPYNREAADFDREPSKFVPATITKRNLHLPYSFENQDGCNKDRRSVSLDFDSNLEDQQWNSGSNVLTPATIEHLRTFLANIKLRSNEDAILDFSSKPRKTITSTRKARINRRMAFKRKKSLVAEQEDDDGTDDENSTSTDVDDRPSELHKPRRGSRRSKSSRNGGDNRHPKDSCYHCRFGDGCSDSSLPYTPPTSLRRT
ncbi:hypothetical protein JTE90_012068 [Oedothorax gibbosus]|uniref:Uncharacterized protein n=1 Tax=Oedothorax gibbosus TaxID=931172 RepID=A0AAV6U5F8_9ARAC|nr:hypothetical protein JTE90_012068 [Oedothorax gibbosus]